MFNQEKANASDWRRDKGLHGRPNRQDWPVLNGASTIDTLHSIGKMNGLQA